MKPSPKEAQETNDSVSKRKKFVSFDKAQGI
jgi:hypothetical protein